MIKTQNDKLFISTCVGLHLNEQLLSDDLQLIYNYFSFQRPTPSSELIKMYSRSTCITICTSNTMKFTQDKQIPRDKRPVLITGKVRST